MTGERQDQRVGEGGQAIQAGNDVIIYQGVSPTQIAEILALNSKLIEQYQHAAKAEAEVRFQSIEEKIQQKFADQTSSDTEAFKEPDFQYVVREVQNAFVRTGDESVADTLVNLLAQRSLIKERNLTSLVLNEAVEVAGKVAKPELAILTLGFLLYKVHFGVTDCTSLIHHLKLHTSSFIDDIPDGEAAYGYLSGLGCVERETFAHRDLHSLFVANYGGVFNDGFTQIEFQTAVKNERLAQQIWTGFVKQSEIQNMVFTNIEFSGGAPLMAKPDTNKVYKFSASNATSLENSLRSVIINDNHRQDVVKLLTDKVWQKDYLAAQLRREIPNIDRLYHAFDSEMLSKINLTTKGIALAHSSLMHAVSAFKAPLSIWIR